MYHYVQGPKILRDKGKEAKGTYTEIYSPTISKSLATYDVNLVT